MTAAGTINVVLLVSAVVTVVFLLVALVFPERF
ncbi:potassium-transporting ATPase subunit F [Gordonia sp. zg691]|uniref:Potassium-transporting ATPase subunit F n=1 Tax=Gordonia jinghuaiqii TaxID=2758710 RepID=A0A7D7QG88_9ACTN|nr:potassium-transporting ATPase subunit F [Gordonia jinghuaiqii]MBD0863495.1 potassium-transporting ATPase subunit F [Gordonia jinghuaiqii]MCR5979230.1 potassium-transporting ATPase subunit F [Gordonia jinghuaiqii]QMT01022.1 potassium-transporting ATPase subunit F [Gordonia jinghuaiqii]